MENKKNKKSPTKDTKALVVKTTKAELDTLRLAKEEADRAYFKYKKAYNEEHNIKAGNLIADIIALHKKGVPNKEIVEMGYNKNTVSKEITLYKKGKKSVKTTVRKFLTK